MFKPQLPFVGLIRQARQRWKTLTLFFVFVSLGCWFLQNHIALTHTQSATGFSEQSQRHHAVPAMLKKAEPESLLTAHNHSQHNAIQVQGFVTAYEQFKASPPAYLNGTQLRGGFPLDQAGNLIPHAMIKARFDYFFLMVNDLSQSEILAIIRGNIYQELNAPAREQALELVNQYADYLVAYNQLIADQSSATHHEHVPSGLQTLLIDIQALRVDVLGATYAEAFFAKEAWLQRQALQPQALQHEHSEQPADEDALQWRAAQQQTARFIYAQQKQVQTLGEHPSSAQLQTFRVNEYGHDAANRLAQLDQQRAHFQQQVDWVIQQRQQQSKTGLSVADSETQLRVALAEQFGLSSLEIRRVLAVASFRESPEVPWE